MKTLVMLCSALLLPLALCRGQTAAVYDAQTDKDLNAFHTDFATLNATVTTALNTANGYLQQIQTSEASTASAVTELDNTIKTLSTIIGNPGDVTSGKGAATKSSVNALNTDINNFNTKASSNGVTYSTDPLKHFTTDSNSVPQVQSPAITGSEVYNETAGGLFTAIGSTYTPMVTPGSSSKKVPSPVGRTTDSTGKASDGVTYKPEAAEMAAINDYYRVRDAALTRREALQSALSDAVKALDTAVDFASVEKITALIQALQSQIQSCDNDVTIAFNDMAARGMQVYTMNSVVSKATAEPAQSQMNANLAAANALATTPPTSNLVDTAKKAGYSTLTAPASSNGYSTSFFPWTVYK